MKKLFATVCVLGSLVAVAACSTDRPSGDVTEAPYAEDRTAGKETTIQADVRAETVYREKQTK